MSDEITIENILQNIDTTLQADIVGMQAQGIHNVPSSNLQLIAMFLQMKQLMEADLDEREKEYSKNEEESKNPIFDF